MRLRTIIFILSLLTFLTTITGGFLYYSSVKKLTTEKFEKQGFWHAQLMANVLDNDISANLKVVKDLSGRKEITQVSVSRTPEDLINANQLLDHFNASYDAGFTYLMDHDGSTIASSNRNDPDSVVGENYSFRSYFKKAIQGTACVDLALGVTTHERGIYYSHPVYSGDQKSPSGVVVMKISTKKMEKKLLRMHFNTLGMIAMVTGPNGVIFMSDHNQYSLALLERLSDEKMSVILASKQFGDSPLPWSGFYMDGKNLVNDSSGDKYIVSQDRIPSLPGWSVVHLHNMDAINASVYEPVLSRLGWIIISFCILVGLASVTLYQMGKHDIIRRKTAEKTLVENENFLKSLLEAIPIPVFYKNRKGVYLGVNRSFETFFGKTQKDLVGKSVFDISPEKIAQIYHAKDNELFESRGTQHYESNVHVTGNEIRDVIFDKSVYVDDMGQVAGLIGTVLDITIQKQREQEREKLIEDLQNALTEIKTLEGIVPICSKCKKIRDDKGYWSKLESYIEQHSDASFSHSMCPECSDKLYGVEDWYIKMKKA